jgi:hypothetical protein
METQVNETPKETGMCGTWLLTKQSRYQMDLVSLRNRFQDVSAMEISFATN